MYTGGIETLILRMTDWLIKNNHSVDILLLKKEGELLSKINKKANVFGLGNYPEIKLLKNYLLNKTSSNYDVIYSFSPVTTWMALLLGKKQKKTSVVLNGVYHPFTYKISGDSYTRKLFNYALPDRCKIFMTPVVKDEHEKILKRKIVNPIIWPLSIDSKMFENITKKPKKFKIVSIGRLTDFKTYNIYMLDVIKKLRSANYDVDYYIYGTGELYTTMIKKINKLELNKHVFLLGTIEYDKIPEILSNAYAFIGMGTAVIESGFCKVPSIVAIAYSKQPVTYGYIHELPDYNCGEFIKNHPTYDLYNMFIELFNMKDSDYNNICNTTLDILKEQYGINFLMQKLLNEINCIKRDKITFKKTPIPFYYILIKTKINLTNSLIQFLKKTLHLLKIL